MARATPSREVWDTTGRATSILCLVVVALLTAAAILAVPVAAPPPIPMRTQGQALDRTGSPLPVGTPIRTFVDGVDYSNGAAIQNGIGSFVVLTAGNSKSAGNVSDTPTTLEGPNLGDSIIYTAVDFTTATDVFQEVAAWSPGAVVNTDLHLGSVATTPQPIKIEGIVTHPARGGNQFVFLCSPTASPVSLADYYLELDALKSYHGGQVPLNGVLDPATTFRVDLPSATWAEPSGDALKLVYRNPGGAGASAGGRDVVVDRLEFNATRGGTLDWEPGNTIMGDAPAPDVGRILQRDANCTDTNTPADFSLDAEPGLPPNGPPTVSITVPSDGQTIQGATAVTFVWTMSDDIFSVADLHVWANVTIGNQTTALLADAIGETSVVWPAPDLAVNGAVLRVDVEDPFGARASDSRTFNLTRQSPIALVIAILIATVLGAFVIFGLLRARKTEEKPPSAAPPTPPTPPQAPPPQTASLTPDAGGGKKVCARCHTAVNAVDTTCFFCGYRFPEETIPPP